MILERPLGARDVVCPALGGLLLGVALTLVALLTLGGGSRSEALIRADATAHSGFTVDVYRARSRVFEAVVIAELEATTPYPPSAPRPVGEERTAELASAQNFLVGTRLPVDAVPERAHPDPSVLPSATLPLAWRSPSLNAELTAAGDGLRVIAHAADPDRARTLATTAAALLIDERRARRDDHLAHRVAVLDVRLVATRAAMRAAEQRLEAGTPDGVDAARNAIRIIEERTARAAADLVVATADLAELEAAARPPIDRPRLLAAARSGDLERTIAEHDAAAERRLALGDAYGDRHPTMISAVTELARLEAQVVAETERLLARLSQEVGAAREHLHALRTAVDVRRTELAARLADQARAAEDTGALAAYRERLTALAAARTRLVDERETGSNDARIVAVHDFETSLGSTTRLALMTSGGGVGTMVGIGLALVRSQRRNLTLEAQANRATARGLPVLARLSAPSRGGAAGRDIADAMEKLALQLEQLSARTVAISAVERPAGDDIIAATVARIWSRDGQTTLLIDAGAHSRAGRAHERAAAGPDLADVLRGDLRWSEALIAPTKGQGATAARRAAFWRLVAHRPLPAELTGSAFDELVAAVRERFDRIVVAAPALATVQGLRLAKACDAVVVVTDGDDRPAGTLDVRLNELDRIDGRPVGLVLVE